MAPAGAVLVRFSVSPAQTGPLFPTVGAAGIGGIVTNVVAGLLVHPSSVAVTE